MNAYLITGEPCPRCIGWDTPGWAGPHSTIHCPDCAGTGRRLVTLAEGIIEEIAAARVAERLRCAAVIRERAAEWGDDPAIYHLLRGVALAVESKPSPEPPA